MIPWSVRKRNMSVRKRNKGWKGPDSCLQDPDPCLRTAQLGGLQNLTSARKKKSIDPGNGHSRIPEMIPRSVRKENIGRFCPLPKAYVCRTGT